jgi:transcriptional regulator with XRE-family HTH domain
MADKDLRQLRRVLEEAVRASRTPIRELERALGLGHGSLYRMFNGDLDLRVRHLLALAELLGIPPTDFLELGCPDAMSGAKRRLTDWIGHAGRPAEPTAASLSLDQLKELIRSTVREELEQQSATPERNRRSRH